MSIDKVRKVPLWRHRSFTLMWTSTAASGFGDRMIMLAALALLGGLGSATESTSIHAATQFWFFLPYILFSILGGWLADRLPRKWLLLGCDEMRGLLLLAGYLWLAQAQGVAALGEHYHWRVFLILVAIGAFASIFNPTRNAIIPQIIPRSQLQSANAVILVINVVASMVGMVVGGWIISESDVETVRTGLIIGSLFYLVSGTFFAFLKPVSSWHTAGPQRSGRSLLQAAKYARRHRRVLILILLNIFVWASAAAVSSGILGLVKQFYGLEGDALMRSFTMISAALGVGMLIGAAVVILIGTRRESTTVTMLSLCGAGVCLLILATTPVLWITYASALLLGVFANMAIIAIITMLQSISPNYVRGRIMGINNVANTIFSVLTYLAIWQLPAADTNIIIVMYLLGPGLIVVGLIGLARHLRSGPARSAENFLWRVNRLFVFSWHRLEIQGGHHIPLSGPVILASNHTTGLDPLLIQAAVPRVVRWVMTRDYQFRTLGFLWRVTQPIVLDDGSTLRRMRQMIQALREDQVVGIFPEGGVQRDTRELKAFAPGTALLSRKSKAMVVPVWIEGTPRTKNMLWHFLQPSRSRIIFGQPYRPENAADDQAIIADLRRRMLTLADRARAT